jgi:long-chain fatty acid transport protein
MGMAGAVVSAPQDALTAAVNPAATGFVGTRADMDVRGFIPIRKATLEFPNPPFGPGEQSDSSSNRIFPVPSGGFSYQISDTWAVGFTFFGNGGMNTTYKNNLFDPGGIGGASRPLSIDLAQLIFAPNVSFKFAERHSIGIAPLIAMQKFKAEGLENFQCFTSTALGNPTSAGSCMTSGVPTTPSNALTGNGDEIVWGVGVKAGYVGQITDHFSLGIAGSSPVYMGKFEKYSDLFAEEGDFDIPATISAGISWNSGNGLTVAFDWQRIFYEGVNSIANPGPVFNGDPANPMPTFPPGTQLGLPPSTALARRTDWASVGRTSTSSAWA